MSRRLTCMTPLQRLEPVAPGTRTHGQSHQADIQVGCRVNHERHQCERQQALA
jgi:hypothetical protein